MDTPGERPFVAYQQLRVADSFRVRKHSESSGAEVRGWQAHCARFAQSVRVTLANDAAAVPHTSHRTIQQPVSNPATQLSETLQTFFVHAAAQIAAFGEGFPRFELWRSSAHSNATDAVHSAAEIGATAGAVSLRKGSVASQAPAVSMPIAPQHVLALSLRPLPPLTETLTARTQRWVASRNAVHKGALLDAYVAANHAAGEEVFLCDGARPEDAVREGASTSLIVWVAPDRAYISASTLRVPSITESLLRATSPTVFTAAHLTTALLIQHEVWAVNALHGIRVVEKINNTPLPHPHLSRLSRFRALLDSGWEPVRAPTLSI